MSRLSPHRSVDWKGFQSSSTSSPFIFSPETLCDSPKDKELQRDTMTLNLKVQGSSTSYPLNFQFFNNKLPIIHTIWLSHVSQECHSGLFHVGAGSTTYDSTWPVCAIFKYEIVFCSHFINMTKHRKIKIQNRDVSIQIY